jgi:hypothetical protein
MARKEAELMLHVTNRICGGRAHSEGGLGKTTLGQSPIRIWVLVAEITDKPIMGLDVPYTYGAFLAKRYD